MLNHPTHERLIELGLTGMAKAFEEQRRSPDLEALPFEDRIGLLVDREPPNATPGGSPRASRSPHCARLLASRTSICAPRGASTAPFSPNSSKVAGSIATRICSSPGQPAWAKVG
ncbi:hypothetical protein ABIF91_000092 [Bradyrhizobium sp. USDA 241]